MAAVTVMAAVLTIIELGTELIKKIPSFSQKRKKEFIKLKRDYLKSCKIVDELKFATKRDDNQLYLARKRRTELSREIILFKEVFITEIKK